MKLSKTIVCVGFSALLVASMYGQTESKPDQMTSEPPKIFAQKLVNETLAKHKDVIIMAMHVTPPNKDENVIIASNIGRYGKKADEDDLRVINTGQNNLEVNKAGNHFEDELPLLDQAGNTIGAVGIVFNYKNGDDKTKLSKIAEKVRNEMRAQIPSKEKLFESVP